MIRKLHEDSSNFNITEFRDYVYDYCETALIDMGNDHTCQDVEREFPSYDAEWCADEMSYDLPELRERAIKAMAAYEIKTLLYNKD